jgi:hypothetical protein
VRVIKGIVGVIVGGFLGWIVGLFYHASWWLLKGIAGDPFNISSGLFLYTLPYAAIGALLGAAMLAAE